MLWLSKAEIVEAVIRASFHSARNSRMSMRRGFNSLATVVSTAPFIGFLGTVFGIYDSFTPSVGRTAALVDHSRRLSIALMPTALGLFISVAAYIAYRFLSTRLEEFDLDMETASVDLANYVTLRLHYRR